MELLALFLESLNCFQIKGSIIVDVALFFRKSLLCISCSSSLVIQGERLFLTLFFLNGACLSITLAKFPERKRMNVVSFTWKCQKIQFFFIWAGFSFIFARPVALAVTIFKFPQRKRMSVVRLKMPKNLVYKLKTLVKWRSEIVFSQDTLWVWLSSQAAYNLFKMVTQVNIVQICPIRS